MTEELFRAAKNAEHGSMESYWSHRLYRGPLVNGQHQKTTVHYCKSIHTTERVLKLHFAKSKVIGFDIEWKENAYRSNDARQNVSLIQIANEERVALFHVALYPKTDLVSPTFKKMMEDSSITKVGVSIKADCTRLRKHLGIDTKGMLELSHLYKLVKFSERKEFGEINRRLVSLAKQTQEHLHLPMYKGDVRISDWSKKLSLEQIMYAASDSYAGLQLFYTLEMKRLALDPTPPRPYHAELNLPIRIAEGVEIPSDAEAEEAELEPEDPTEKANTATTNPRPKQLSEKELEEAKESASCHLDSLHTQHPKHRLNPHHPLPSSSLSSHHLRGRNLRTYFLWYENPELSLKEIGAMLRSPPLSERSVAVGILEAIRVEGVKFEKERLR
ncbi:ribonuclease H-like protein, partial [Cadophora sp. DSE1049]